MIPKIFPREQGFVPFPPYMIPSIAVPFIAPIAPPGLLAAPSESQLLSLNSNVEIAMQNQRRKMLRRAANRRSAQLSRARKKAHLEELKAENLRLQRLVDVLESQPEFIFCITPDGKITYISEVTVNFITAVGVEPDEDPASVYHVLTKDSAEEVLAAIEKLRHISNFRSENCLELPYAVKTVQFHDALGQLTTGYLRCCKVQRKISLDFPELHEKVSKQPSQSINKKLKISKEVSLQSNEKEPDLSNFRLLADCVTSLTEGREPDKSKPVRTITSFTSESSSNPSEENTTILDNDTDDEYVCIIRTTEGQFRFHNSQKDIIFLSACLGSDQDNNPLTIQKSISLNVHTVRVSSPSDSNNSSVSDVKTVSDVSKNRVSSSSSETMSEDNTGEF